MGIGKGILRWGLIGGLALGGLTWFIGPENVASAFTQVRGEAKGAVQAMVDDPVALRRQLAELAEEYPERIQKVETEIAQVDLQLDEFNRDIEIARRVVAMTTDDLQHLKTLVARAETQRESAARPVAIRFEGARFKVDEAYAEAQRINRVRETYKDRLANDVQQREFLEEQKARLVEIRDNLESDYATYQAKLWQLDRQIDAVERNERLIEMTEQQQATLKSYSKMGEVANLKQIESKLAELRTVQEAQLKQLSRQGGTHNYERQAELDLETDDIGPDGSFDPFEDLDEELEPAEEDDESDRTSHDIAFAEPIVVE